MAVNTPIAVLRYTWKDFGPHPPGTMDAEFEKVFTSMNYEFSVSRFWSDTTLGLADLATGSSVLPWRVTELDHGLYVDAQGKQQSLRNFNEVTQMALEDVRNDYNFAPFTVFVVFMDPPPSPSVEARTSASVILIGTALTRSGFMK